MTSQFLGLSAGGWTAILAAITLLLVATGLYQIVASRTENRKTQRLAICGSYDTSPNIYAAQIMLWEARMNGDLVQNTAKYRPQINCVLAHLDAVAIGIDRGLYINLWHGTISMQLFTPTLNL